MTSSPSSKNLSNRAVSVLLFCGEGEELALLLIKRKYPPFMGQYAFPGGFIKEDEDFMQGAHRKLLKETHIEIQKENLILLSTRESIERDPRGASLHHSYLLHIQRPKSFPERWQGESVDECAWVPLKNIKDLAFDHGAILCQALSVFWPNVVGMQKHHLKISLPRLIGPKKCLTQAKIVFFPGTFNPWHKGHKACVDACKDHSVIIMPDRSPWKNIKDSNCRYSVYLSMAREFEESEHAVYPGFVGLEEVNPTILWMQQCQLKNKWLLMGLDLFLSLPKWKDADKLVMLISGIYVVPRIVEGEDFEGVQKIIKKWNKSIEVINLKEHNYQDVSSTKLRQL